MAEEENVADMNEVNPTVYCANDFAVRLSSRAKVNGAS